MPHTRYFPAPPCITLRSRRDQIAHAPLKAASSASSAGAATVKGAELESVVVVVERAAAYAAPIAPVSVSVTRHQPLQDNDRSSAN